MIRKQESSISFVIMKIIIFLGFESFSIVREIKVTFVFLTFTHRNLDRIEEFLWQNSLFLLSSVNFFFLFSGSREGDVRRFTIIRKDR